MKQDIDIHAAANLVGLALRTAGVTNKGKRMYTDITGALTDQDLGRLTDLLGICTDARLNDCPIGEGTLRQSATALRDALQAQAPKGQEAWLKLRSEFQQNLGVADATSSGGWMWGDRLTDTPEPHAKLRYPTTRYEDAYADVRQTVRRDIHRTLPPEKSGIPSGAIDMLETWNGHPEMLRKARGENFIKKHVEGNPHIGGHARDRVMKGIRNGEDGVWFDYDNILGVKQDGIFLKVQLDGLATMYQAIPSTTEPVADARYDRPAKEEPRFAPLDPQELRDIEYGRVHVGSRLLSRDDIVEYAPPAKPMHNASTLHSGVIIVDESEGPLERGELSTVPLSERLVKHGIILGHSHNANAGETNGAPKPAEASTETIIEPATATSQLMSPPGEGKSAACQAFIAPFPTRIGDGNALFGTTPSDNIIGSKPMIRNSGNYFQEK